jgi:hypothetical protein
MKAPSVILATYMLTLAVGAPAAYAAPIYLDCKISGAKDQKKFSLALDESTGQVTHTDEGGPVFSAKGLFAADKIYYRSIVMSGLKFTFDYELDRTSLDVTETLTMEPSDPKYAAQIPPEKSTMAGVCKIVQAKRGRKI